MSAPARTQALEALVEAHARELHLPAIRDRFRALAAEATREQQTPLAYLAALLEAEVQERAERRERRRLLDARFPEWDTGALSGRPRARLKPPAQVRPGGQFGEVAVAVLALDFPGVLAMGGLALRVIGQTVRTGDAELLDSALSDDVGHVGGLGEEGAQEPCSAQLHREVQAVVIAAAAVDQRPVAIIEVKEPIQLRDRRRLGVAPVGGQLAGADEVNRHSLPTPLGLPWLGDWCQTHVLLQ